MQVGTVRGAAGTHTVVHRPQAGNYPISSRAALPAVLERITAGWAPEVAGQPVTGDLTAPYRDPGLILGIGLNYPAHAADLDAMPPRDVPASFLKGRHTLIGPGEPILLPPGLGRVTAEAELGLVIGRPCHRIAESEALFHVAGVVAVLDQTAEDVLRRNPRYLTLAKNHPSFFSFGPLITTLDEVLERCGRLADVEVRTVLNGATHRGNTVSAMRFPPEYLVSFHSHVMPLQPGDIIATGTPGAVAVTPGDRVACALTGLMTLENPVRAAPSADPDPARRPSH